MIKIIMAKRGTGKSKTMVQLANKAVGEDAGEVVFINNSSKRMYEVKYNVRFIDTSEFNINDYCMYYGFICGIISENFDISQIYIDEISEISDDTQHSFKQFLSDIQKISDQFNITFTIAVDGDSGAAPDYLKKYIA